MNTPLSLQLEAIRHKPTRLVVGVMSGTSVDGIDVAICRITGAGPKIHEGDSGAKITLLYLFSCAYPTAIRNSILTLHNLNLQTLAELEQEITDSYAVAIRDACKAATIPTTDIDLIGCHGQTIYHHSRQPGTKHATLQLCCGDRLAYQLGVPVVSNFRVKDIAAGGEGAPLSPYGDQILYQSEKLPWGVLNLGGIANISVFNGLNKPTIGFDTGPANAPIDRIITILTNGTQLFDEGGELARQGQIIKPLLEKLMTSDKYLQLCPPKSAGFETYGNSFVQSCIEYNNGRVDTNLLTTITEFVALSISDSLKKWVQNTLHEIIVAGGGSRNTYLIERIQYHLPETKVRISDEFGIPAQAREAMIWALLANDATFGFNTSIPSVTGATRAVTLGAFSSP
jgi:anhydro-N-acetylmuramic acid kinase